MTDLVFIKATKQELWAEIKRLETEAIENAETPQEDTCNGECSDTSKRNLHRVRRNYWEFRKPGAGFGIGGTQIYYCPYCGKKLQ